MWFRESWFARIFTLLSLNPPNAKVQRRSMIPHKNRGARV